VHGAQTDLKSVAICDEQVRVRFLYRPPNLEDVDPKVGHSLGKRGAGESWPSFDYSFFRHK